MSTADDRDALDAYSRAVIDVVEKVGPAVVALSVKGKRRRWRMRHPRGAGSGVVVTPDGYLLTNSHVIAAAREVDVAMSDGSEARARIVGDDPATDLALLRIMGSSLPFAELSGSLRARPGQLAIAMGNPLGFQSTVSAGVVSAGCRSLRGRDGRLIDDVIQHTAPLNPGSSGGPLLDSAGRVLGINTAIIAWSQGIGFSVPATTAAWVLGELISRGRVKRAWLGIAAQKRAVARQLMRRFDLTQKAGVEVSSVEPRSPAARAHLREGDVILALDGEPVEGVDDLHRLLRDHAAGKAAIVTVMRRGDRIKVPITPTEMPHASSG